MSAIVAKPTGKAEGTKGKGEAKGKGGAKGKGSPKGKGKKGSTKTQDDGSNEAFECPFEGLWLIPGRCSAASVDTVNLKGDPVLVAAAEDGRVYVILRDCHAVCL